MYQRKIVLGARNHAPQNKRRSSGESSDFNTLWEPLRKLDSREGLSANLFRPPMKSNPHIITQGPIRLLISASPTTQSLSEYTQVLRRHNVKHVIRLCEPMYDIDFLRNQGFRVHDWPFPDEVPPSLIISNWLNLLDIECGLLDYAIANASAPVPDFDDFLLSIENSSSDDEHSENPLTTIAIHCANGIGRAPLLAALALIESGMDSFEAIGLIRGVRHGSISLRQMSFLETYKTRPLIANSKQGKIRSRSTSVVGSLWTSFKTRPFRTRSPSNIRATADPEMSAESFFLPKSMKLRPTRYP